MSNWKYLIVALALECLSGCTRWKTVTVPVRVVEPCLTEPPPQIPPIDLSDPGAMADLISALEDASLYGNRAWARCGGARE